MGKTWYTFLPVYWGYQHNAIKYNLPIIASDLYNTLGVPGSELLVHDGIPSGYVNYDTVAQEVTDFLGFNPFLLAKFQYSANALTYSEGLIPEVIETFKGALADEVATIAGPFWFPDTTGTYFTGANYETGTLAGYGGYIYGGGGLEQPFINTIRPASIEAAEDGMEYYFEIWPKEVIARDNDTTLDTSKFTRDNGLIRSGQIHIVLYKQDGKWFFNIYLRCFNYFSSTTQAFDDILNGFRFAKIYKPEGAFDNVEPDGNEGGTGGEDPDSDPIDVPPLPSLDISDIGGYNLYKLNQNQLTALFTYLTTHEPGAAMLKWFQNPIQGIISLHILPYPVLEKAGGLVQILDVPIEGVSANKVSQWQEWNMGSVTVPYFYDDTFLDYEPYSKCQIFLPFIGMKALDMDEIVGKSVSVVYQFENITGSCVAFVTVNKSVRYTYTGSCAIGLPVVQSNWGQLYMAAATVAAGAITGGVASGVGAAGSSAAIVGINTVKGASLGALGAARGVSGSMKPTISRSGSVAGAASALGVNRPYLVFERMEKAKTSNPAPVIGLASGRTLSLGSLSGFNMVQDIHLSGISATAAELDEIESLLKQGVIL